MVHRAFRLAAATRIPGAGRRIHRWAFVPIGAVALLALAGPLRAAPDLTTLSIEQLMDVKVTSVAKKPQRLIDAAAAIHVISAEDIRRSGATTIPDLLRTVPGLLVAQIDANKWAVTARGFSGRFANKLLVLIDGRTVYSPFFSGVFWEVQDTLLADIERIEVIRGPGAAIWGANAVNGVINIITKRAEDTQGALVEALAGSEERINIATRFGGTLGSGSYLRTFAKFFVRDDARRVTGGAAADGWRMARGGFRWDLRAGEDAPDDFTVEGELYQGRLGQTLTTAALVPPYSTVSERRTRVDGQYLLAKWRRSLAGGSEIAVQSFVDHARRDDALVYLERTTVDIELQHRFRLLPGNELIWGLGYRYNRDRTEGGFALSFDPVKDDQSLFTAFVQDEVKLFDDALTLTFGAKFEHNEFSGFEIQPTARALWRIDARNALWGAVSRAVRTPSRAETDTTLNSTVLPPMTAANPGPLPVELRITGPGRGYLSEEVLAFELGYRTRPVPSLSLDVAAFYNDYNRLRAVTPVAASIEPDPTRVVRPLVIGNTVRGDAYGVELGAEWSPADWWRLRGAYTYFDLALHSDPGVASQANEEEEDRAPNHQLSLTAQINPADAWEFDATLRFVDNLSERGVGSYATLDLRLAWKPAPGIELSLVGRNLLQRSHVEFAPEFFDTGQSEIERSIYGKIQLAF
jgi:iron complex outermembrane recepter protein